MTSAPVLLLVALLLDALAFAALAVAWRQFGRQQGLLRLLAQETVRLRLLLQVPELRKERRDSSPERAPSTPEPEEPPAVSAPNAEPEPEPRRPDEAEFAPVRLPPDGPAPVSALDRAVAAVNGPLAARLAMLGRWESAAGVPLGSLSSTPAQLQHRNRELADAQSMAQVTAAAQEIDAAWPDLLRTLAGSMDRDLDPARGSAPLQKAMEELLRDLGVGWIDPTQGTPFEPRRHQNLGVFRPGTAAEAGRVGEVLCRGLEDRGGRVLLRAEVREFG